MSEEAIKKRLGRAKKAAIELLGHAGYCIVPSDNKAICIVATRSRELRMIRICIDRISSEDEKLVRAINAPIGSCSKEIWFRKSDSPNFEIREIH